MKLLASTFSVFCATTYCLSASNAYSTGPNWKYLSDGDTINVVHPSSKPLGDTTKIQEVLEAEARKHDLFINYNNEHINPGACPGDFYSNSVQNRASFLKDVMENPNTKSICCNRGGFGASEIVEYWEASNNIPTPHSFSFLGFSDTTTLHNWFHRNNIPTLHGPVANFCKETSGITGVGVGKEDSISEIFNILKGNVSEVKYELKVLNPSSLDEKSLRDSMDASVLGGNFSVLQRNGGTSTQLNGTNSIVFLEDTSEAWNRLQSLLSSVYRTGSLDNAQGIFLGDFPTTGPIPAGDILTSFSKTEFKLRHNREIPIYHAPGFGHGPSNQVLPFGTKGSVSYDQSGNATLSLSINQSAYGSILPINTYSPR